MHPDGPESEIRAALNVTCSFSGRRWQFRKTDAQALQALQRRADLSTTLAQLLLARNVRPEDVNEYLNPTLRNLLPEPFLLRQMKEAIERTAQAIRQCEQVAIFGDYDVDGSCSAALLYDFLRNTGQSPLIYVPDRVREGYGPNAKALLLLKERGARLVITVDCGAGALEPLIAAREAGLDVIVLDHHAIDRLGDERGFPGLHVNPNQPGDGSGLGHLCAAGITFLFVVALNRELRGSGWYSRQGIAEPDLRKGLDLVGLATVCDVVPLIGVNRAFVRAAELRLSRMERLGVRALAAASRKEPPFSLYDCGFVFGPRINAGGRVGRCSLGVELLTTQDSDEARGLAELLENHNRERQALEISIIREAVIIAEQQEAEVFLLVSGSDWHPGVVGLVASRLKDRFHKPAFAIGFNGESGRGSARSVGGIDVGSIVRGARDEGLLQAGGGHAMAAGFALNRSQLGGFRNWIAAHLATAEGHANTFGTLELDALVAPSGATVELVREIGRAGPFGAANSEPVIATSEVRVAFADAVGQGHVRVRLQAQDGSACSAIAFRAADTDLGRALLRSRGERIHAAGFLRENRWNGSTEVQLQIEDAAAAG